MISILEFIILILASVIFSMAIILFVLSRVAMLVLYKLAEFMLDLIIGNKGERE